MPRLRREFPGYRAMWLVAMFDLPVHTKSARRDYSRFRKKLIALWFQMVQFSVYAKYFPSVEASASHG